LEASLTNLRPQGIAYFQIPTYMVGYQFKVSDYLRKPLLSEFEMHPLPQHVLFDIIARCGCQLLEIREDNYVGNSNAVSNSILLKKR